jgi:DNA invertase Pin-like site-specific DNA recombinase
MAGRKFGYSRVSTSDQDWSLQLEALTRAGVDDRDVYREKASGAKRDRTELRRMIDQLRPGDQATVYRLDRLARSQLHLLQIIEEIETRGAKLVSVMDNIDTSTATGKMVVGVLAVLSEFERNLLMERSAAGRAIARQRQVRFGRPPKLTPSLIRQVLLAHDDPNTTVPEVCRILGISKSSYYAALRAGRLQSQEPAIQAA